MPEINLIPESSCLYDGNQPYHVLYDNLPLKNILRRIELVNTQVDINTDILRGSGGNVGSLNNRLLVSLHDNGKIISSSVDNSLHNIGYHLDGSYEGVEYVRMTQSERDKLSLIGSEANNLQIEIEDKIDNEVFLENPISRKITSGTVVLRSSDTVFFNFESATSEEIGNNVSGIIKAHCLFPPSSAHRHNYGIIPVVESLVSPNNKNYITTTINTQFIEGSLRVHINGVRLNYATEENPTPSVLVPNSTATEWNEFYIQSQNAESGEFSLNSAIGENDQIVIDFDESLSL